jgi:hypothetical protein
VAAGRTPTEKWAFRARFRVRAFGWKSQPAISRLKEALAEIHRAERIDPVHAAEGAILLLERISPAFEQVDGSSGAIGSAVNHAIAELVQLIAGAEVDRKTREKWLERLYLAHESDQIPYIERLGDHWGELCATKEIASAQADRLIGITRMALRPDKQLRAHFHGTSMCCSALLRAERYDELIDLVSVDCLWHYKRFAAKALAAQGKTDEAIAYAESCRNPWASAWDINRICEESLLAAGRVEDAYRRYGLVANTAGTYVGTLRAIAKKYPDKKPNEILRDLVRRTPGEEGKWFAAAKDLKMYPEALDLASRSPCEPKTLTRAARDFLEKHTEFALGAGLLALRWLASGHGYEITSADVWAAYQATMNAAERLERSAAIRDQVRRLFVQSPGSFAGGILSRELGLQ